MCNLQTLLTPRVFSCKLGGENPWERGCLTQQNLSSIVDFFFGRFGGNLKFEIFNEN